MFAIILLFCLVLYFERIESSVPINNLLLMQKKSIKIPEAQILFLSLFPKTKKKRSKNDFIEIIARKCSKKYTWY